MNQRCHIDKADYRAALLWKINNVSSDKWELYPISKVANSLIKKKIPVPENLQLEIQLK